MYDPKLTFLEYELSYRADRIRAGLGGTRRRHPRVPRVRRPAVAADNAR